MLKPPPTYDVREVLPPGTRTVTGAGTSPMIGRRQYWTEIRFGRVDSGEFELECAIDTEKALPDTDRSNNSRSASFEVPGAPVFDLAVVDITGTIRQDGPVIYAHVENRGNQDVLFAKIECFRAGSELAVFVRAQPGETDIGWGPNQSPTPPVALGSRSTRCVVAEIRNPSGAVDSNPSNDELTKLVVIE